MFKKFKPEKVAAEVVIQLSGPKLLCVRLAIPQLYSGGETSYKPSIQEAIDQCDRRIRGVEPGMCALELDILASMQVYVNTLNIRLYFNNQRFPLPTPLALPAVYHSLIDLKLDSVDFQGRFEFLIDLSTLKRLTLNNCGLTCVPSEIERLSTLEFLTLAYNNLKSIPVFIGYMPNLRYLNLEDEPQCSEIPLSVGGLRHVTMPDRMVWPLMKAEYVLGSALLNGLVEADQGRSTPWTCFLRKGLYDPRLFLFVWAFCF